jgi:hypothetical protein
MAFSHSRDNSDSAYCFPETWNSTKDGCESDNEEIQDQQASYYNFDTSSSHEISSTFRCAMMIQPEQAQIFSTQAERDLCRQGDRSQGKGEVASPLLGTRNKRAEHLSCWNMEQSKQEASETSLVFEKSNHSSGNHDVEGSGGDQQEVLKSSKWVVSSKSVPTVPFYYPLERTHVVVPLAFMSSELLAALICMLCQKLSLAAEYNHEKAIATLTVSDGTNFVVKLYGQESENGTIVECQKMSGDSETFYSNASKLLQVCKGVDHVKSMIFKPKPAHSASFSDWKNRDVELDLPIFDGKSERRLAYEQVEWAAELLNKDRVDAKALGMEMLASMTDTKKSSAVTCKIALLFFVVTLMRITSMTETIIRR